MSNGSPNTPSGAVDAPLPAPGTLIAGKYAVERILGQGGMGVVLAARHQQLGQTVAIKIMRQGWAADRGAVARFHREARAVAALSSEHVAKVLDVGALDDGSPYIVLEYLAGVDLGALLQQSGPMTVGDAVGAVVQACEALAEAHALGIVHRDLKPSNLFVTKRNDGSSLVKVLDFGISKTSALSAAEPGDTPTASGYIMGSPGYMSPEQVRSARSVDARSDVWSVGVILYELLTGVAPFAGETVGDTLARIVSETPRSVHELCPDLPSALSSVIARCLERDVTRRVQSIASLATMLHPFAPAEQALSVVRILRIAGLSGDTIAAPYETIAAPLEPGPASPRSKDPATEASWQRSGTTARGARGSRWTPVVVLATMAVAVASVGGVYAWRRPAVDSSPPKAEASASVLPSPAAPTAAPQADIGPAGARQGLSDPSASAPTAQRLIEAPAATPEAGPRAAPHAIVPRTARPVDDPAMDDLLQRRQ